MSKNNNQVLTPPAPQKKQTMLNSTDRTMPGLAALHRTSFKENVAQRLLHQTRCFLSALMWGLGIRKAIKPNSMCKYYGHKVVGRRWSGPYPKCDDCGTTIKAPEELRQSTIRKP